MVSSESLDLLLPNLVWWCIIMSQIAFQKDWFAVLKVKVTMKDHVIKVWLSNISSELLILNLVWWHIIISWIVLWKDWNALLWPRSRLQKRLRIPVTVHLEIFPQLLNLLSPNLVWWCIIIGQNDCLCHIYWTAALFAALCNWMVHHH